MPFTQVMGTKRIPSVDEGKWILVLGAAALVGLVFARSLSWPIVAGFVLVNLALIGYSAWELQCTKTPRNRPDGVLLIAISQMLGLTTSAIDNATIRPALLVVAAIIGAVGTIRIIVFRLGSRSAITEREIGIVSAGLGLTFYILIAQPTTMGAGEAVSFAISSAALTIALFGTILLLWLATFDTDSISLPFALVLAPQAFLIVKIADLTTILDSGVLRAMMIIAAAMPMAAYWHPKTPDVFSIAMFVSSEVNARRSLITFSVILMGPALIGIDQLDKFGIDPQNKIQLSPTTITIGSSILSVIVASHLLLLIRRWADVEHQGQHDPLTGLPNRQLFFNRLESAIEGATVRQTKLVVMFLDLDRFKAVNDTLGHEKGDLLLRQVSERLDEAASRVGPHLTVARLGGDEFAIVVPSVRDDRHAHAMGRMFLDQFLDPFDMGLRDIYVTPSIGMAQFPRDGNQVKKLIENADTAMFEAKERGRNTVVNYQPEQRTPGIHRLEIEAALHKALANNELEVYYQPQIDITSGNIFAVEALLRWKHPTLGLVSPDKFVPVAEESALIDQIGRWTLDEACRVAASWGPHGLPEINVAVNLSPRQFQQPEVLTDDVARSLQRSGLDPRRLELELTESLALEHPEEVNATLLQFRAMGIRTAIDDFGVGHTGLDYLDRITVDTLKIDRSFVDRIGETGAPLVTAVISLARGLNLDVIAEGVETPAQVEFLRSHGCRYMQGYLFSKPLTGAQLLQVLHNQVRKNGAAYTKQNHAA